MKKTIDVLIIGGGASGLMAAVAAGEAGANTLIIEKNPVVGRKLLLTGGGRCNVSNNKSNEAIIDHVPGNGKFLFSSLNQFSSQAIRHFFTSNGLPLKEEDHGRLFPVTDQAQSILDLFLARYKKLPVSLRLGQTVQQIVATSEASFTVMTDTGQQYAAKTVILATGGRSYPQTGSTGDGYRLARSFGHSLKPVEPAEAPLCSSDPFIQKCVLQGISLSNVCLSVLNRRGKVVKRQQHDLLFTHFGLSGPCALRCSTFVLRELKKQAPVIVELDALPNFSYTELEKKVKIIQQQIANKASKYALKQLLPERYVSFLLEQCELDPQQPFKNLSGTNLTALLQLMKKLPIKIDKTWPVEKSFVTAGGVHLKEIIPQTMESRLAPGLYFSGELLDIHGYTGGYNLTAAFSTGHSAGKHAAENALNQSSRC